jgi:hypothetical protein
MKIAFGDVRGGAPLAELFCGHYCGYRRDKLWASKKATVLEAHGMGLTIKEVDNAKPYGKPYRLADGGGLCLFVAPSGAKLWRWRYRFNGREKTMSFGESLAVLLEDCATGDVSRVVKACDHTRLVLNNGVFVKGNARKSGSVTFGKL